MTQLLLFDTPAAESFAPIAPISEPIRRGGLAAGRPVESIRNEVAASEEYQRGLNHMGDLARLVLLRYDLVAQRRARRLAKVAAANA
jgi:hypothetical protein